MAGYFLKIMKYFKQFLLFFSYNSYSEWLEDYHRKRFHKLMESEEMQVSEFFSQKRISFIKDLLRRM